jgi:hypothetical protein
MFTERCGLTIFRYLLSQGILCCEIETVLNSHALKLKLDNRQ